MVSVVRDYSNSKLKDKQYKQKKTHQTVGHLK